MPLPIHQKFGRGETPSGKIRNYPPSGESMNYFLLLDRNLQLHSYKKQDIFNLGNDLYMYWHLRSGISEVKVHMLVGDSKGAYLEKDSADVFLEASRMKCYFYTLPLAARTLGKHVQVSRSPTNQKKSSLVIKRRHQNSFSI